MGTQTFELRSEIPCSADELMAWHLRPLAFERLQPPWDPLVIEEPMRAVEPNASLVIRTRVGPVELRWRARIVEVGARHFVDEQVEGPFSSWRHQHVFEPIAGRDDACTLIDRIEYAAPLGALGAAVGRVENRIARTFRFRHETTRMDIALGRALQGTPVAAGERARTIVVTGASGLIGREVCALGSVLGHRMVRAVRTSAPPPEGTAAWNIESGVLTFAGGGARGAAGEAPPPVDAIVHMAGESIAKGRLTGEHKRAVMESRAGPTRALARWFAAHARAAEDRLAHADTNAELAQRNPPAPVFVSASGVGFYGSRGDELLPEASARGSDFLADVCVAWEDAAAHAGPAARDVSLRTGLVASPAGGALAQVLPLFEAGLGGKLGDGTFWQPWLSVDDHAAIVMRAVLDDRLRGPVNAVPREAVTNATYTETLARVLRRPALAPVPRFALKLALGDLADAVTSSSRAVPQRLLDVSHVWRHADLEGALRHVLGRMEDTA